MLTAVAWDFVHYIFKFKFLILFFTHFSKIPLFLGETLGMFKISK
jgi:hypothetical protein